MWLNWLENRTPYLHLLPPILQNFCCNLTDGPSHQPQWVREKGAPFFPHLPSASLLSGPLIPPTHQVQPGCQTRAESMFAEGCQQQEVPPVSGALLQVSTSLCSLGSLQQGFILGHLGGPDVITGSHCLWGFAAVAEEHTFSLRCRITFRIDLVAPSDALNFLLQSSLRRSPRWSKMAPGSTNKKWLCL